MSTTPAGRPVSKPLSMDDPIEWWDEEAKRLGVASGQILREQTRLSDEIILELIREDGFRERCAELKAAEDKLEAEVDAHFRPLIEAALAQKEYALADKIMKRVPDVVTRVFLWDTIRQHKLTNEKG